MGSGPNGEFTAADRAGQHATAAEGILDRIPRPGPMATAEAMYAQALATLAVAAELAALREEIAKGRLG